MAAFLSSLLVFIGLYAFSSGFMQGNPCEVDVWPTQGDRPSKSNYTLPAACTNGTFRWDYPKYMVKLHIPNEHHREMSVCIQNSMLGNIFTVRDVTHAFGMPLVIGKKESCTKKHRGMITLRIDAPEILYYVGAFLYHVYTE